MAHKHDINIALLATIGIVSVLLLIAIGVGGTAFVYYAEQQEQAAKFTGQPVLKLANLRLDQETRINSYRWIDPQKQVVAIPIDRAMELIVQRAATQPSRPD